MTRTNSFGVAAALALLLIASAAVVVTRAFETPAEASQQAADGDEDESPPAADEIAHAGERLAANGFEVSDEVLTELATKYGVGGAVASSPGRRRIPTGWPIFASCATVTARKEAGWAGVRSRRSWECIPASVRSWATAATMRVPVDGARIADMRRRIRAWLASRVKPFERRWIPIQRSGTATKRS